MNSFKLLTLLALPVLCLFASPAAFAALAQRTFVSGQGNDANPCTLTAPCRSFGQAISVVAAGGEVVALDSAGYGPFSITKSLSVQAPPGVYAAITTFSGTGIAVNAGASDNVTLRGLTVVGLGGGIGIQFSSGNSLLVVDCAVSGFSAMGLLFQPSATNAVGTVDRSQFKGNGDGVYISPTGNLTVRNSIMSGNAGRGAYIFGVNSAGGATLSVVESLLDGNTVGIRADTNGGGPSHVRLSNNHITNNSSGIVVGGNSDWVSIGNNMIRGNGTDKSGTITVLPAD